MYYFMYEMDMPGQRAYTHGDNSWILIKQCECKSRRIENVEPIHFYIDGQPCDYYFVNNMVMVSERFYSFLKERNLTGFKFRNADAQRWHESPRWNESRFKIEKKPEDLKYYEMVVTGRCGLLRNMSGIAMPHCKKCGRRLSHTGLCHNGVSFDPEAYDGSDIFAFDNLWNIPIVTEELRDAIIAQGFTNIRFVPLNEKVFDDTVPIHLIQQWLNEGRAEKILIEAWLENGIITPDMIPDKTAQE